MRKSLEAIARIDEIAESFQDYYSEGDIKLDHIPDVAECRKMLCAMKAVRFWPNVFHVNDHGNVDLLTVGYNGARIINSWV